MGKRQHYVPQFYLKNFATPQSQVGFYRFADDLYRSEVPISSILFENWFYDQDNSYEHALSSMESQWNASLNSILSGIGDYEELVIRNPMDFLHVLSFVSFSEVRTSKRINGQKFVLRNMIEDIRQRVGEDAFSKVSMFDDLDLDYMPTQINLEAGTELFKLLLDLDWLFIVNITGRDFITCDAPVANINPYLVRRQWKGGFGNGAIGLQKLIPLSNRVCLCLYDSLAYNCFEDFICVTLDDTRIVRRINKLFVENSMEQIVFHPSFPRCEAKGLCKGKKYVELDEELQVFESDDGNLAYGMSHVSSKSTLMLPWFSFNEKAMNIPFPSNMAGLLRPYVKMIGTNPLEDTYFPGDVKPFVGRLANVYTKNSSRHPRPCGIILDNKLNADRN